MGAFKDLLDVLRATVNGLIPLGGTLNPTSEGVPMAFAHNITGASFPVENLGQLADIPYQILMLGMELHVTSEGKTYRLTQLPAEGTKVSDVVGYDILDYWEEIAVGSSTPGADGDKGWTILWGLEDDGPTRVVEIFAGYIGGEGDPPASPTSPDIYRGPAGFTTKTLAINVKGPQGNAGSDAQVRPTYYNAIGARRITPPVTTTFAATAEFFFASDTLWIQNTWSQSRTFLIFGEVPFTNVNGSVSWVVRLNHRADVAWGGAEEVSTSRMDENYSRMDFVNAPAYQSGHKINVRGVITLPPGGQRFFRMTAARTNGGAFFYSQGFIEAIGL